LTNEHVDAVLGSDDIRVCIIILLQIMLHNLCFTKCCWIFLGQHSKVKNIPHVVAL